MDEIDWHTKQVGYPQNFQDLECNSDPHGKVITSKIIRKYMKLYKHANVYLNVVVEVAMIVDTS